MKFLLLTELNGDTIRVRADRIQDYSKARLDDGSWGSCIDLGQCEDNHMKVQEPPEQLDELLNPPINATHVHGDHNAFQERLDNALAAIEHDGEQIIDIKHSATMCHVPQASPWILLSAVITHSK